jgi:hypothetical protein
MTFPHTALIGLLAVVGCAPGAATEPRVVTSAVECQATHDSLLRLVEALPPEGFAERGRPDLPTAALGGVLGDGLVVDAAPSGILLDGQTIEGDTTARRLAALRQRLDELLGAGDDAEQVSHAKRVYLATPADTDVGTLRSYLGAIPRGMHAHLLFEAPPLDEGGQASQWSRWPARLWRTRDPALRRQLAEQAYAELTTCAAVLEAATAAGPNAATERWPALRAALLEAIPRCRCDEVQSPELRQLVIAEQRAGAASLGSVPLDFVRDERCGASLFYSSTQRLLGDIEAFDEEFSGQYGTDAVSFEQVVTNERLLNYLCKALPGETLSALQRARHTIFWRVPGVEECQAWQLDPLMPGSPMGTWRQIVGDADEAVAVHYRQGAEEIRLFGPLTSATSKPTDEGDWACDQNVRMRQVDAESIHLERGRWFFTESACRQAPRAQSEVSGCVADLAAGKIPAPPVPAADLAPASSVPVLTETGSTTKKPTVEPASGLPEDAAKTPAESP